MSISPDCNYRGDAMSITNKLNQIKNAIYGKEVRGAIHDAIKECYVDASVNHDNANMEVKMARGPHNTLNDRLDNVDEIQAQTNAQLSDIATIKPSGDITGVTDKKNIIKHLSTNSSIRLSEGEFWINDSILFPQGKTIVGAGKTKTIINTVNDTSVFHSTEDSTVDHVVITDLKLRAGTQSTKRAIDFVGSLTPINGSYTGCSYSTFKRIDIEGFKDGFYGRGFWCTLFEQIRTFTNEKGIIIGSTVNDVTFNKCSFLGGEYGIHASSDTSGGSQLTSFNVKDCNIERSSVCAIYAYSVLGITVENLHCESVPLALKLDNVPAFKMIGGNILYVDALAQIRKSSALEFYKGKQTFIGTYVQLNTNDTTGLIHLPYSDEITDVELIDIDYYNKGTGVVSYIREDIFNLKTVGRNMIINEFESESAIVRYSSDKITHTLKQQIFDNQQIKIYNPYLVIVEGGTATSSDTFNLVKDDEILFTKSINAGTVLTAGQEFQMSRKLTGNDFYKYIFKNNDVVELRHTNTLGVDIKFKILFKDVVAAEYFKK